MSAAACIADIRRLRLEQAAAAKALGAGMQLLYGSSFKVLLLWKLRTRAALAWAAPDTPNQSYVHV
jgi:hypothetical protein